MPASNGVLDIKMNRKGFGLRASVRDDVQGEYSSPLIDEIKAAGYSKAFGRLTVHLAREFGFCYGVDRAVEMAYETRRYFPDKKIYLTTEIIHNPTVNRHLLNMGVRFLSGPYKNAERGEITRDDVVIVPAFGTTVRELKELHGIGCTLVDTICGSVVTVWKRVERYAAEGFTAIIHGKYNHEETQATSSRVGMFPEGQYLVVLDDEQARVVCDYIVNGGDKAAFQKKFEKAMSPGFDPDRHLARIGVANQTTMLSSESLRIAAMLKGALITRYGAADIDGRYMAFDTICSATQERQDAIVSLRDRKPDLILVIGGYNSSNTTHLVEIAQKFAPSYHIQNQDNLLSAAEIRHQPFGTKAEAVTAKWLPAGPISIGITAGASTPNSVMGEVLQRLVALQS